MPIVIVDPTWPAVAPNPDGIIGGGKAEPKPESIIGTNGEPCEVIGIGAGGDPILACENETGTI